MLCLRKNRAYNPICMNKSHRGRQNEQNHQRNLRRAVNQFVNQMVESGRYGSTSEVIRAGLRMLEEKEQQLLQLRKLIDEGLESGESDENVQSIINRCKGKCNV